MWVSIAVACRSTDWKMIHLKALSPMLYETAMSVQRYRTSPNSFPCASILCTTRACSRMRSRSLYLGDSVAMSDL